MSGVGEPSRLNRTEKTLLPNQSDFLWLFQHDEVELSSCVPPFSSVGIEHIRVAGSAVVGNIYIPVGNAALHYL